MAIGIREKYLQAASELELAFLLNYSDDTPNAKTELDRIVQQRQDLNTLCGRALQELTGPQRDEVQKVHAQVNSLFLPADLRQTRAFFNTRNVHFLRIAVEHNLTTLVRQYFRTLPIEQRRSAFNMLCNTFGRPLDGEKTSKNGIHHIASDPRNLLSPLRGVKQAPRIIDILLQSQIASSSTPQPKATSDSPTPTPAPQKPELPTGGKINSEQLLTFHQEKFGSRLNLLRSNGPNLMNLDEEFRWLFPLEHDVDDPSFFSKFVADSWCISCLKGSFKHVLDIYGFEINWDTYTITAKDKGDHLWLRPEYKHWQNHIERILICMQRMGLPSCAYNFFMALEKVANTEEGKEGITDFQLEYWRTRCLFRPNAYPLSSSSSTSSAPGKIDSEALLNFYWKGFNNTSGMTHTGTLLRMSSELLSLSDEEIRWMFPLAEDVDDPHFVSKFKTNAQCQSNLGLAFKSWLNACGLQFKAGRVGCMEGAYADKLLSCWKTKSAPHLKHVERILKCLTAMGLENSAQSFFDMLDILNSNKKNEAISGSTLKKWGKALPESRQLEKEKPAAVKKVKIASDELIAFYSSPTGASDGGSYVDLISTAQPELELMKNEKAMRWLFPLEEDVADPSVFAKFGTDSHCRRNLKKAFNRMLDLYQFQENGSGGSITPKKGAHHLWLWPDYKHWQNHIERILKCLLAMNFPDRAYEFFMALQELATTEDGKEGISQEQLEIWRKCFPPTTRLPVVVPKKQAAVDKIDSAKLLAFCKGEATDPRGRSHGHILQGTDVLGLKEEMRWVFPLAEDVVDPTFVNTFKADERCMKMLKDIAFKQLLRICGLEQTERGVIQRKTGPLSATIFPMMDPKLTQWQQNIERILKCLHTMGLDEDAVCFLAVLKDIKANEGKDTIPQSAIEQWNRALGLDF